MPHKGRKVSFDSTSTPRFSPSSPLCASASPLAFELEELRNLGRVHERKRKIEKMEKEFERLRRVEAEVKAKGIYVPSMSGVGKIEESATIPPDSSINDDITAQPAPMLSSPPPSDDDKIRLAVRNRMRAMIAAQDHLDTLTEQKRKHKWQKLRSLTSSETSPTPIVEQDDILDLQIRAAATELQQLEDEEEEAKERAKARRARDEEEKEKLRNLARKIKENKSKTPPKPRRSTSSPDLGQRKEKSSWKKKLHAALHYTLPSPASLSALKYHYELPSSPSPPSPTSKSASKNKPTNHPRRRSTQLNPHSFGLGPPPRSRSPTSKSTSKSKDTRERSENRRSLSLDIRRSLSLDIDFNAHEFGLHPPRSRSHRRNRSST